MAETTYDRTKPQKRFTAAVSRGLRESAVIAIGVIALVMLVSLLSYHREDPAFSSTGGIDHAVGNKIGPFGAWLSDILFFLFGRPAYLFPLMLGVACFVMFRKGDDEEGRTRANTAVRIGGFTLMLFASCGLATLHWSAGTLRETAGGVVGQFIGNGLAANLNFLGATLLMLAAWMAGVSLAFGVSWLTIVDRIGAGIWNGISWMRARRSVARDVAVGVEAKKARVEAAKVEEKKAAARARPRIEAPAPVVEKSERVEKERQVPLFDSPKAGSLPPMQLLDDPPARESSYSQEALEAMSRLVELKLKDFGVEVEVVAVQPGPVVTRFEMRPAPGVKVSQITSLSKDLARSLSAISVRVVEVIPGKSVMGLEIPNEKREIVTLGEIIKSKSYDDVHSPLALALGKDIGGAPVTADLAKMPHLLAPVVTDMKHAANALRWCVAEMERRYQLMSALGVRNIAGFNRKVKDAIDSGKPIRDPVMTAMAANDPTLDQSKIQDLTPLPYIVVIIDELADLMMIVGKKVEELIARLAQKARASGIHLVLATQRPAVDVITGLI
jgi:S-DNA-T family DNA segregation ATPase FtsK/SpoIIIE